MWPGRSASSARARLDAAVDDGRLTQEEADVVLERLENGELPRFLRDHRRGFRRGGYFPGRGPGFGRFQSARDRGDAHG
jgi:hypothetical protein